MRSNAVLISENLKKKNMFLLSTSMKPRNLSRARNAKMQKRKRNLKTPKPVQEK